jgi:hypothetical protein
VHCSFRMALPVTDLSAVFPTGRMANARQGSCICHVVETAFRQQFDASKEDEALVVAAFGKERQFQERSPA